MQVFIRFLLIVALVIAAIVVAAGLVVYSGTYDISAKSGHSPAVASTANALMERSVRKHARDVVSPVGTDFRTPGMLEKAAAHFDAMCVTCHGAPGKKPDPWELYPPAPDLADAVRDRPWNDPEIFWIIKNGIKDTGMSAFGGSHSDQEIWALTALIRQFPTMKSEQYADMVRRAHAQPDAEKDEHGAAHGSHESAETPKSEEAHKH